MYLGNAGFGGAGPRGGIERASIGTSPLGREPGWDSIGMARSFLFHSLGRRRGLRVTTLTPGSRYDAVTLYAP